MALSRAHISDKGKATPNTVAPLKPSSYLPSLESYSRRKLYRNLPIALEVIRSTTVIQRLPAAALFSVTLGNLFIRTHVPLSPSSINWYRSIRSDTLQSKKTTVEAAHWPCVTHNNGLSTSASWLMSGRWIKEYGPFSSVKGINTSRFDYITLSAVIMCSVARFLSTVELLVYFAASRMHSSVVGGIDFVRILQRILSVCPFIRRLTSTAGERDSPY